MMMSLRGSGCLRNNLADKARHEKMVKREIEPSADRAIDRLVYELYGLSEEEVKVVET